MLAGGARVSVTDPSGSMRDMEWEAEQLEVLDHARGGLVVTGPPGCGRTTVLRERFARLLEGGADPERVVLFTLNRRAARQARDAILRRVGRSLPDLPVFTVHGYGFRVLGDEYGALGYPEPPQVLSAPEQYAFVRQLLQEESAGDWPRFGEYLGNPAFVRQIADFVLRAQERLLGPEALADLAAGGSLEEVAAFYGRYLDTLAGDGSVDFAGLLFQTVKVLEEGGPADDFAHVLVDDYQDATHAAEGIVRILSASADSAVVAADPEGHVFSYRGGTLEPFVRLDETLGRPDRVHLPTSHRLGDAAPLDALDEAGAAAADPPPWLSAVELAHPGEEAEAVAHELLRRRVEDEVPWESMAVVLRRYGPYLTAIRHALARHGIPFVVVAEAAEIATEPANRPLIDLLRFVFQPDRRPELAEGLLTSPIGDLDPHQVRQLRREARRRGQELLDLMLEGSLDGIEGEAASRLRSLRDLVGEMPAVASERGPDGLFHWLWTRLPFARRMVEEGGVQRDLDAVAALGSMLGRFVERRPGATVEGYLETLDAAEFGPDPWIPPEERTPGAVRVISAHRAQGLEFEVALVAGCLEGEFPSLGSRSPLVSLETLVDPMTPTERLRARFSEERALFRLAVSRARRATVLFASTSSGSRQPRSPSRFAARMGVGWRTIEAAPPSVSLRSMEASLRRILSDAEAAPEERLAALAALPAAGARPERWWRRRDWTDPGVPLHDDGFKTSYSRLAALEACGLLYLGASELGLDPDSTHYMWLGSLVHGIIERIQRGELPREQQPILDALLGAWDSSRFPNRAVEARRRRDAISMLQRWFEYDKREAVAVEQEFRFEIAGALLRGRIDAIFPHREEGGIHILDYKTGKSLPSQKDIEENLQLAIYYLAAKLDPEVAALGEPRSVELAFLGKEHWKEGFGRRSYEVEDPEAYEAKARQKVEALIQRVRDEDFQPVVNDGCRFCELRVICPVQIEGGEVPV